MKYKRLVKAVGEQFPQYGHETTEQMVTEILQVIAKQLRAGNPIHLNGIGNLMVVTRAARVARNLRDPANPLQIPARKRVKFQQSRTFNLDQ